MTSDYEPEAFCQTLVSGLESR